MMIDTHTHLYSDAFDEDREAVVKKALDTGVSKFFIPAIDAGHTQAMYQLEKDYPGRMHLMMGLHPTSVGSDYKDQLRHVEEQLASRSFYAVGEIGIDLYWDTSTLPLQREAFKHQIGLAKQYGLPIVIHCRDAFAEIFEVLETEKDDALFGIFHCFTGTYEDAQKAISFGMKLGIGGVVTFKNGKIDQFLHKIPLEHLVLETDSPYLAPAPFRGKRNESSYLALICEKVAQIYGVSEAEIQRQTTKNALEIFTLNSQKQ
jgi:TatD DNase family protein